MKRTILSRVGGAVVALALGTATLAAAGAATPAGAAPAATCTSTATVSVSYVRAEYGDNDTVRASASATCSDGNSGLVDDGAMQLFQSVDGGRSWVLVASGSYGSAIYSHTATGSALFRAHYAGGKIGTYTFPATDSTNVRLAVIRAVGMKFKSGHGSVKTTFTVQPAASVAGLKVLVQVKKGRHWKKYKKIRFRSNGKFVGRFGRTGHYRLVLPTARGLDGYTYGFRIWRS